MLTRWRAGRPGKTGAAEAKELGRELEERIEAATRRRIVGMAHTLEALENGWQENLENDATFVMEAASLRSAIRNAREYGLPREEPGLRFQVSSLFLKDCRDVLRDPQGRERMHLVSGTISDDGVRVMTRHPAFIYIDEAQEYFDSNIDTLLIQARKYRVGITLAHHTIDQLKTGGLKASVLGMPAIRFTGDITAADASTLAPENRWCEMVSHPRAQHFVKKEYRQWQRCIGSTRSSSGRNRTTIG